MTIDWSKAPEGATHFLPEQRAQGWVACWYKNVDGTWFGRNSHDCDWYPDNDYVDEFVPLLMEKPSGEWTGEGLPPVGTVCEVKGCISHYLQWNKVTVFAVRGKTVFFDMEDGRWGQTDSHEFRPVRTPEQIAAEEREKAAYELASHVAGYLGKSEPNPGDIKMSEYLYDQGYRLQVTS